MDAYVFIREADDETLRTLQYEGEESGIRFVTSLSGPYDGFVALTGDDLASIERTVKRSIRGAGALGTETAIVIPWTPPRPMPKYLPAKFVEAFVQIRVRAGMTGAVLDGLMDVPGALGVAAVAGTFDVLFEAGADSFDELTESLRAMHQVDGILWTTSCLASFPEDASRSE